MTMNLWRPGKDQYGWKLSKRIYDTYLRAGVGDGSAKFYYRSYEEDDAPIKVKAVPRISKEHEALYLLFGDNERAMRLIIGAVTVEVLYLFGGS